MNTEVFDFLKPVFKAFHEHGESIYLVGGCVRDQFLGIDIIKDFDLTTTATPDVIKNIMASLGANVIDKNGGNFGTIHSIYQGHDVEVTTHRADESYGQGNRRPRVNFSKNIKDDLGRRDFTINSMALNYNNHGFILVDYFSGLSDLLHGDLRSPQDPNTLMSDDPLRILRAYRFAARFGLRIDKKLRMAMRQHACDLRFISVERIQQELIKICGGPNPDEAFRAMMEDGVLIQSCMLPEIAQVQIGYNQINPHHHLPLWEHTLEVVRQTALMGGNWRAVWTALLHDVAKPYSNQRVYKCLSCEAAGRKSKVRHSLHPSLIPCEDPYYMECECSSNLPEKIEFEKMQYLGHDMLGAILARDIMGRLKFSNDDTDAVVRMIDAHQTDFRQAHKKIRRFANKFGDIAHEFIPFLKADRLGHTPGSEFSKIEDLERLEEAFKNIDVQEALAPKLPLNGNEVMDMLGMRPGKELGVIMKALKEAFVNDEVLTRGQAIEFVKSYGG